jgi:uncharacterized protein with GYD domain
VIALVVAGGRLISAYVTFGGYDLLFIVEYLDQKSALAAVETNLAKGCLLSKSRKPWRSKIF